MKFALSIVKTPIVVGIILAYVVLQVGVMLVVPNGERLAPVLSVGALLLGWWAARFLPAE